MSPTTFKLLFLILGVTLTAQALPNPYQGPRLRRASLHSESSRAKAEYSANNNERNNRSRRSFFSRHENTLSGSAFDMRPEGMRLGDKTPVPPLNSRMHHGALSNIIPFMVSLQYEYDDTWFHFCGATIITTYALLTAAHCFPPESQRFTFRAVYGTNFISAEPTDSFVQFLFDSVHLDSYVPKTEYMYHLYDNAVVLLSEDIPLGDKASVICLAGQEFDNVPYYFTFGWGRYECDTNSNQLRYASGWLVEKKDCEAKWLDHGEEIIRIQEGQMCAVHATNEKEYVSIDKGDSGGPMIAPILDADGIATTVGQFGIVSYLYNVRNVKPPCPNVEIPQVFSKVSSHIEFIHKWAPDIELCKHP